MWVDLVPEWFGLMLTPLAVVGAIVLLGTERSLINALSFAGAFALNYSILSIIVLWVGSVATSSQEAEAGVARYIVSLLMGLLFLGIGAAVLLRHHVGAEGGKPRWAVVLETATPVRAFLGGFALSLINPNVVILLSGLTFVITSGETVGTQVLGALSLVLAALIPFAIPIGIYLIMGERGKELLRGVFAWMMEHDKALTAGTMFFFGAIFVGRGLGGLLG
jgi:threonine/homoserine/homoserine lactone efflux protein